MTEFGSLIIESLSRLADVGLKLNFAARDYLPGQN